jgi:hypothetical protein
MAGYSGTPLLKKIGIRENDRLILVNEAGGFRDLLGELPKDSVVVSSGTGLVNVAIVFTTSAADLKKRFVTTARRLEQNGILWVAWPKRSSGVTTDLNENVVRNIGLATGLVDTKVCAIDETWSGLRFVIRLKDRKQS